MIVNVNHDLAGRLTKRTYPDGNYEVYAYTADGRPASVRNARGGTTLFAYNAANMLASLTGSNYSWTFQYDGRGLLTTASSGTFSMTFAYDQYGKKVSESRSDITGTQVARTYDNLQRLSALSYNNRTVQYVYDAAGRVGQVVVAGATLNFAYLPDTELISSRVWKDGSDATILSLNSAYDHYSRLSGITANNASEIGYTMDDDDRRTAASLNDSTAWAYSYDGLNQVVSATRGTASYLYSYDDIGNRATASEAGTSTNYTANDLNQYTAVGNVTPTYDDDGNLLTYDGWTYTWDIAGQLTTAAKGTQRLEFEYDHIGRRRGKKYYQNNTLTYFYRFVYDGFKLIAVLDGNNNNAEIMSFVWSPAGDDTPLCMAYGGATYLYAADGNKNITGLFDTAGTRAATYAYDPFGNVLAHTGTDFAYKFSTKPETCGLYYYGFRYYHPALGRWINRDPIGEQGGMNLYGMVNNSLINLNDFMGLFYTLDGYTPPWDTLRTVERYNPVLSPEKRCCGLDVTEKLDKLLKKVDVEWRNEKYAKIFLGFNYRDLVDGWDIEEFYNAGGDKDSDIFCGKGKVCEKTVTYHGRCLKVTSLNYLLYPLIMQIRRYHTLNSNPDLRRVKLFNSALPYDTAMSAPYDNLALPYHYNTAISDLEDIVRLSLYSLLKMFPNEGERAFIGGINRFLAGINQSWLMIEYSECTLNKNKYTGKLRARIHAKDNPDLSGGEGYIRIEV